MRRRVVCERGFWLQRDLFGFIRKVQARRAEGERSERGGRAPSLPDGNHGEINGTGTRPAGAAR